MLDPTHRAYRRMHDRDAAGRQLIATTDSVDRDHLSNRQGSGAYRLPIGRHRRCCVKMDFDAVHTNAGKARDDADHAGFTSPIRR